MSEPTVTASGPILPPHSPPLPEPQRFAASDGYGLAYRLWRSAGSPRVLIVALHGIQSHSGWYGYSSAELAEAGYAVAFLDRRGSGANEIARGDTPHADRLVNDVVQFVSHLERTGFGGLPRVLTAVSWGGKLAAAVAARRSDLFDGLALLCPGLCSHVRANPAQRAALRLANAAGAGRREVSVPLGDPALFTDVPEYQEFIRRDPLALRRVTVRFLAASLTLDALIRRDAAAIRCPSLLMLAGRDRIVDNAATRRLVASFGSPVKTLLDYPEARHTLEFEPNRDRFVADLTEWLERTT
ncbi:MAG TPA: alpha/beta fold hydrolase [Planctomycetaceae bacterium]